MTLTWPDAVTTYRHSFLSEIVETPDCNRKDDETADHQSRFVFRMIMAVFCTFPNL